MSEQSRQHPKDPLHGVTLEHIVRTLVERHGWAKMGYRIPVRCFQYDPSVKSSLTFLRKTPWARERVEQWYADEARRAAAAEEKAAAMEEKVAELERAVEERAAASEGKAESEQQD